MPVLRAAGCSGCACNTGRLVPSARVQGDLSIQCHVSALERVECRRHPFQDFGAATPARGLVFKIRLSTQPSFTPAWPTCHYLGCPVVRAPVKASIPNCRLLNLCPERVHAGSHTVHRVPSRSAEKENTPTGELFSCLPSKKHDQLASQRTPLVTYLRLPINRSSGKLGRIPPANGPWPVGSCAAVAAVHAQVPSHGRESPVGPFGLRIYCIGL